MPRRPLVWMLGTLGLYAVLLTPLLGATLTRRDDIAAALFAGLLVLCGIAAYVIWRLDAIMSERLRNAIASANSAELQYREHLYEQEQRHARSAATVDTTTTH